MECRAYGICLDSQSRGYLGKDRKVSSAAGGNLSRMHKTQETAKESRLNFMYSHLRNRTLDAVAKCPQARPAGTTPIVAWHEVPGLVSFALANDRAVGFKQAQDLVRMPSLCLEDARLTLGDELLNQGQVVFESSFCCNDLQESFAAGH